MKGRHAFFGWSTSSNPPRAPGYPLPKAAPSLPPGTNNALPLPQQLSLDYNADLPASRQDWSQHEAG